MDTLQQATFRGVAFHVEGHEGTFGRRAVVHEYALRDKPYVEDLGRRARAFTLDAFIIGADYMQGRDALAEVLEQPGPGPLVHPYLGERTVTVLEFRFRESTAEGGLARFSISVVEAGEITFPSGDVDTARQVDLAADDAMICCQDDFADSFTVDGFPEFVADAAGDQLEGALGSIDGLSLSLPSLPDAMATFGPQLAGVRSTLDSLMQGPAGLASALTGLISGLPGLMGLPLDAITLLRGLFDFGADDLVVPSTTPSRVQQAANQRASNTLMQRAAVIEAARSSSQVDFAGFADAVALRDNLAEQLDQLAEAAESDEVYSSLVALRTATIRDITTRGADLSRTVSVTPVATLPALVLAYGLYDDASREGEIVTRNNIRHPGFVPGGRPLEVLADA